MLFTTWNVSHCRRLFMSSEVLFMLQLFMPEPRLKSLRTMNNCWGYGKLLNTFTVGREIRCDCRIVWETLNISRCHGDVELPSQRKPTTAVFQPDHWKGWLDTGWCSLSHCHEMPILTRVPEGFLLSAVLVLQGSGQSSTKLCCSQK